TIGMLARLSIRDIVLIDRLDIDFADGLSVLTGETGAGKSILLDAFALALGARGDVALVRHGAAQGQVTAAFELPKAHPARALMAAAGITAADELMLRRVQFADGRTRAFANDQPVGVQVLKSLGAMLVEIHGQHDERALVDTATHRYLLDAFGGIEPDAQEVARLWDERRACEAALAAKRAEVERAQREADWLRHAVEELAALKPAPAEETALAERRTAMMAAEKVAGDPGCRRARGGGALSRGCGRAFGGAAQRSRKARQGGQRRAQAAAARARKIFNRHRQRTRRGRPARHRPGRILGLHQSGHAA